MNHSAVVARKRLHELISDDAEDVFFNNDFNI